MLKQDVIADFLKWRQLGCISGADWINWIQYCSRDPYCSDKNSL